MIKINLLPWREQLREEQKRQFLALLGLVVGLTALIMLTVHLVMAGAIASQESRNNLLKVEISALDTKIEKIKNLQKQKESLLARMKVIQELQTNRPLTVKLFDSLAQIIPPGIYLTAAERHEDKILVTGFAESNSEVSQMMRNINASDWITNAKLTEVKKRENKNNTSESIVAEAEKHSKQFILEFSIKKADEKDKEDSDKQPKGKKR